MNRTASNVVTLLRTNVPALAAAAAPTGMRVRISFPASVRADVVSGRVYVALNRVDAPTTSRGGSELVPQAGPTGAPLFGVNVENLKPGAFAEVDGAALGHPVASLNETPKGDFLAQAFVNVYTKFERADGHTVWLHMVQWEWQDWLRSPGNLFSTTKSVHGRVDLFGARGGQPLCRQASATTTPYSLYEEKGRSHGD